MVGLSRKSGLAGSTGQPPTWAHAAGSHSHGLIGSSPSHPTWRHKFPWAQRPREGNEQMLTGQGDRELISPMLADPWSCNRAGSTLHAPGKPLLLLQPLATPLCSCPASLR